MGTSLIFLLIGLVIGAGVSFVLLRLLKGTFAQLSLDALSRNSAEFLKLAQERLEKTTSLGEKDLEGKKQLIDQTFIQMKGELERAQNLIRAIEKDREGKFSQLTTNIDAMTRQVTGLQQTTEQLRMALASTKTIGQWGERMAEDVLRLAGFIEGVNYDKQKAQGATRPDFTFFLPRGLKVNMDVKFPWQNYFRFVEAPSDVERESYKSQFLKDVRQRVKEVTTRDYIDPEHQTVDYVLVFIPNEQVYGFIQQCDRSILDEALRSKVILCSPLTLYAILAVIRQAMDNFSLERSAHQILKVLGSFEKQYEMFCTTLGKMGQRLDDARKEFDHLTTTRKDQLDRQLKNIAELREAKRLELGDALDEPHDRG